VTLAGGIAIAGTAAAVGVVRLWAIVLAGILAVAWIAAFPVVLGTAALLPADISQAFLGDILEMRPITSPAQALSILATTYGAFGLLSGGVVIDNIPPSITNISACNPPTGNVATRVHLNLDFVSVAAGIIPDINSTIVTNSCFFSVTRN
jgi:hypothetical protein